MQDELDEKAKGTWKAPEEKGRLQAIFDWRAKNQAAYEAFTGHCKHDDNTHIALELERSILNKLTSMVKDDEYNEFKVGLMLDILKTI